MGCDRKDDSSSDSDGSVRPDDTQAPSDGNGGDGDCSPSDLPDLTAEPIASSGSFSQPLYVTQPPGASETLYVVEQRGRILRVKDGEIQSPPFLDIRQKVSTNANERGLLGLAFHPNYQENGRFFVHYTPKTNEPHGYNVVAEFERESKNPDVASSSEVQRLVEVEDNQGNHNGGMVTFGPDGHLYVAMGDGGGGCDRGGQHGPDGNGQAITNLFGTLLRLDVDAPDRNFAPKDNPFVGTKGKDQIWAYGLRNPWRFSFDAKTGDLYIGDVGQEDREEISFAPASSDGGLNFGWRAYEGTLPCSDPENSCESHCDGLAGEVDDHTPPIVDYVWGSTDGPSPRGGKSVTGGYVYRGDAIPKLRGYYLYGDFESPDVSAFRYCDGEVVDHRRLEGLQGIGDGLASFGEDNAGELYLVYLASGDVFRLQKQ